MPIDFRRNCPICNDKYMFVPKHCMEAECALLLASTYIDTSFVVQHINELNLYVNVMWFGENLKTVVYYLETIYMKRYSNQELKSNKFMFLDRKPSEIVYDSKRYEMITMPTCEEFKSDTLCFYESTPLLKYYSREVLKSDPIKYSLLRLEFTDADIYNIFDEYDHLTIPDRLFTSNSNSIYDSETDVEDMLRKNFTTNELENFYDIIACDWIRNNSEVYLDWYLNKDSKIDIYIGGIFPIQGAAAATYAGISITISSLKKNQLLSKRFLLKALYPQQKWQ